MALKSRIEHRSTLHQWSTAQWNSPCTCALLQEITTHQNWTTIWREHEPATCHQMPFGNTLYPEYYFKNNEIASNTEWGIFIKLLPCVFSLKKKNQETLGNHHPQGKKADRASGSCHLPRDTQPLVCCKFITPSSLIWTSFATQNKLSKKGWEVSEHIQVQICRLKGWEAVVVQRVQRRLGREKLWKYQVMMWPGEQWGQGEGRKTVKVF